MQQGFGIILLADEVVRSRRAGAEMHARQAREAREASRAQRAAARAARDAAGQPGPRRTRRLALRLAGFVVALTVGPAVRDGALGAEGGAR